MGTFRVGNETLFVSEGGELRVGIFGPPVVSLSFSGSDHANELAAHAGRRSNGTLTLDGVDWDCQLVCSTRDSPYGRGVGVLATEEMMAWLDGPVTKGAEASLKLYQKGMKEDSGAYLKRVVGDEVPGYMSGTRGKRHYVSKRRLRPATTERQDESRFSQPFYRSGCRG